MAAKQASGKKESPKVFGQARKPEKMFRAGLYARISSSDQQTIPLQDFDKWEVITAHSLNGKRLPIENKGPLWIMYPIDKYPNDLMNNKTTMKLVWNLTGLVVN